MPRTNIEETKEKRVPPKKCAGPNCSNKCDFYDSVKKISFCKTCKLNFFCFNEAIKIIDAQEVKDTIEFIFKILEAMNNHAKLHNIDLVYNGFSHDLHAYEERLLNISNKIKDAIKSASIEKYAGINKEAIELKKELDLSELMHNFLKHRFQIDLDQSVRNSSEYPVGNEVNYNKLLMESKKEIQENCVHEYNAKLEEEKEIIHRKYRSKLEELTNQVNENETIIKNKNKEIKSYISENRQLKKEKTNCDIEIESLKENIQSYLNKFFDLYHLKTGTAKPDKIKNTDFELYLDNPAHSEVLACARILKLPDIKRVCFEDIPEINDDLLHFLKHSAPNKTERFEFQCGMEKLTKIDYYLDGLDTALKRATKEVFTYYWIYSKESLERVFKASCNSSRLIINNSELDCNNDFDFSGPHYKTTYLSFAWCGDLLCNSWTDNPDKLERIIKAISLCSMKDSLRTLNVTFYGVDVQKVKEMLSIYGMANVEVTNDLIFPSDDK